jgi:two-component system NarL family sensor kinase
VLVGQGIVEPELTDALLAGRPAAVARVERAVQERVLGEAIARVKVRTPDGRIVYSDEPRLLGARYRLGAEELAALRTGRAHAEDGDLSRPENRYERGEGHLLEVYLPVRTPSGRQLLFEAYQRQDSITGSARDLWLAFAPVALGALVLLWLIQVPLAWSLARRLRRGYDEREALLGHALEASEVERRCIASDLHTGSSRTWPGSGTGSPRRRSGRAGMIRSRPAPFATAATSREALRRLRALVVDLHPPNLHAEGLAAALSDLAAPLRSDQARARGPRGRGRVRGRPEPCRRAMAGGAARERRRGAPPYGPHDRAQRVLRGPTDRGRRGYRTGERHGDAALRRRGLPRLGPARRLATACGGEAPSRTGRRTGRTRGGSRARCPTRRRAP